MEFLLSSLKFRPILLIVILQILYKDISNYKFSENDKTATTIYERFLHKNLTCYVDTFLSKFISAYRKS